MYAQMTISIVTMRIKHGIWGRRNFCYMEMLWNVMINDAVLLLLLVGSTGNHRVIKSTTSDKTIQSHTTSAYIYIYMQYMSCVCRKYGDPFWKVLWAIHSWPCCFSRECDWSDGSTWGIRVAKLGPERYGYSLPHLLSRPTTIHGE